MGFAGGVVDAVGEEGVGINAFGFQFAIVGVEVKEGDIVTEGQALFRYDTDAIKLDIQQAELDMELAEQNVKRLQEEIDELYLYANNNTPEGQMNAARIQQLELQAALCGVVRYPNATTYTAGANPFFGGCGCGCGGFAA